MCLIVIAAMLATSFSASVSPLQSPAGAPQIAITALSNDTIASYGDVGQYCSLAINPVSNSPVIVFYNATSEDLNVASKGFSSWNIFAPFPTPNNDGLYCSVATNATGIVHVSYYNATDGNLIYANQLGDMYVIDSAGDVGQYSSIDVQEVTNSIAISYYDNSSGDLKVAYNASGTSPWVIYTVDAFGDVGQYTDILFMPTNDSIMVNYYDATDTALKQAWAWDTGSGLGPWFNMTIDNPPSTDVGKWSSQALAPSGAWYSSWYDSTNGDLCYGYYWNESDMELGVHLDTVGDVGQYSSIAVNSSGNAFISYYDNTSKDLKIAWDESGLWYNATLDSAGDVGMFSSIGIDSNDAIHIAYYNATNKDLKYIEIEVNGSSTSPPEQIASLSPPYGDHGEDSNLNGLYENLVVVVPVNVTTPGMYGVVGALCDGDWSYIANATDYEYLNASLQIVELRYSSVLLFSRGYDGAYNVYIELSGGSSAVIENDTYTTASYLHTEFEQPVAALSPPYSDYGEDLNANGLYDNLIVNVSVNVTVNGTYELQGSLCTWTWGYIESASVTGNLTVGMQTVELRFDGRPLYSSGYDGAYRVYLELRDNWTNLLSNGNHATGAYSHTEFEPASSLMPPFSDHGEDLNANGMYDNLVVSVPVNVTMDGWYRVEAPLYDDAWWYITTESNYTFLNAGLQVVDLRYSGIMLYRFGSDGAYNLSIYLYDGSGYMLDDGTYTTGAYTTTEFERPSQFQAPYSDYGNDDNGDGLFDWLVVGAHVNATSDGWYTVGSNLYDGLGNWISGTSSEFYFAAGLNNITLSFRGSDIYNHGFNGTYNVSMDLYQGLWGSWLDSVNYTTAAYLYTDFERAHASIFINGNADFADQALADGWPGNGTSTDPYIIAGFDIDASADTGIYITNTNAYFAVINCYIHDGGTWAHGIALDNCINGVVENNTCTNNVNGIQLWLSSNIVLANNTCSMNTGGGVSLGGSNGNTIRGNDCSNNQIGSYIYFSNDNIISNNINSWNDLYGVHLFNSAIGNILANNTCSSNNQDGIYLESASDNILSNNTCLNNGYAGICVDSSSDNVLSNNTCAYSSQYGIVLQSSSNNSLSDNICSSNNWDGMTLGFSSGNCPEQQYMQLESIPGHIRLLLE